jgi:hypothetical protein
VLINVPSFGIKIEKILQKKSLNRKKNKTEKSAYFVKNPSTKTDSISYFLVIIKSIKYAVEHIKIEIKIACETIKFMFVFYVLFYQL